MILLGFTGFYWVLLSLTDYLECLEVVPTLGSSSQARKQDSTGKGVELTNKQGKQASLGDIVPTGAWRDAGSRRI